MSIQKLLEAAAQKPETIEFKDTMAVIDANYDYTPTAFKNGDVHNDAGVNEGSCKVFAFALHNKLNEAQTLALFGKFYREEVLLQPGAENHANIRQFIAHGFAGLNFDGEALKAKNA